MLHQFQQFVAGTKFQTGKERDGKGALGVNEVGKIKEMHGKSTWKSPGFEQTGEHSVAGISYDQCFNGAAMNSSRK